MGAEAMDSIEELFLFLLINGHEPNCCKSHEQHSQTGRRLTQHHQCFHHVLPFNDCLGLLLLRVDDSLDGHPPEIASRGFHIPFAQLVVAEVFAHPPPVFVKERGNTL